MLSFKKLILFISFVSICNCLLAQQCFTCGSGNNGVFHATADTILLGGVYDFKSFIVDPNVEVKVIGSKPLIIRSKDAILIKGTINASGGKGTNGNSGNNAGKGGQAVGGGFDGGNGVFNSSTSTNGNKGNGNGSGGFGVNLSGGGGGGYANFGFNAFLLWGLGGKSYGDSSLQIIYGGSGGGSGSGGYNRSSGGGGAGGGVIQMSSCEEITITLSGSILCNGGDGGSDGMSNCGAGGGGSGGTIFLSAATITIRGKVNATGGNGGVSILNTPQLNGNGGKGADGRVRIDVFDADFTGKITPAIGYSKIPFIAQIFRTLDVKCFGSNDGYAKVRNRGGEYPISYQWSNGTNANEIKDIKAGTYTVTVTEATGCWQKIITTINQPSEIKPIVSVDKPTCSNTNDGVILAGANGGTPYSCTRNLTSSNTFSNDKAAGVMFDINTKKAINVNKFAVNIKNNLLNEITIWYKQNSYRGYENNSSAWINLGIYNIQSLGINRISDIKLNQLLKLGEGTYSFYISNKNGDLGTIKSSSLGSKYIFDHALTQFEGIGRTIGSIPFQSGIIPAIYFTGHINYTIASNNNEQYEYTWGSTLSSKELKDQPAGSYNLTIADALGCEENAKILMPTPNAIDVQTILKKSPNCFNDQNGEIEVSSSGGNLNKTIVTSYLNDKKVNGIMFNVTALKPLQLNKIKLTIKDSLKISIWIKQGSYIGFENNSNSWTNLGSYILQSAFNSLPIEIALNNINLSAGKWSLYLYTDNGNLNTLGNNTAGNISESNSDLLINKGVKRISNGNPFNSTGSTIIQFSGGIEYSLQSSNVYSYLWNTGSQSNGINNLKSGVYSLIVTDIGGCSQAEQYAIHNPPPISHIANILNETDFTSNAIASVIPQGGTSPYYVYWPTLEKNGPTISNISAGDYPFLIVDANGCRGYDTLSIARTLSPIPETGVLVVVPNPTRNHIKLGKEVVGMDLCTVKFFDVAGRLIYKTSTSINALMNEGLNLQNLSDGVYTFSVEDVDQLFTTKLMVIR